MTNLFHQCGHNTRWNVDSFVEDGCGDGLILSPVHLDKRAVGLLDDDIRRRSIFDPQFYLPSSRKTKLATYDFFPEAITGGFSTQEFSLVALQAAEACLSFQLENDFQRVVIPTRYLDQMYTDFVERQNAYTVHPFLEVLQRENPRKPIYLTLVMTSHMIKDRGYRTSILNWVTSIPELTGIYLVPDCDRTTKQVEDGEALSSLITLLNDIRSTGLEVLCGYLNAESVLLTIAEGVDVTCGAFENTRIFSIDKFLEQDEERRGPRARIYLSGLFNWILVSQAKQIKLRLPAVWKEIYEPSDESERVLAAPVDPTFNQPHLYRHHFRCIARQIREFGSMALSERIPAIEAEVASAQAAYSEIKTKVELDRHGRDEHLAAWASTLGRFKGLQPG
jgi:hypothetical protein